MTTDPPKSNRSGCSQPVAAADCLRALPLSTRATQLAALSRQFQQKLPPALAGHIVLASVHAGKALVLATTPAWATRARLCQGQLCHILQALGQQVRSVAVKVVQPPRAPHAPEERKPLAPATAEHLRSMAASLPDPELRARFLELASLADPTPN